MATRVVPHTAGNFLLHIDGAKDTCFISSISGGEIKANNTTQKVGATMYVQKNNTTVQVEPFTAEMGMVVSKPILAWINETWQRKYSRRNGAWHIADQKLKTRFIREFYEALIVETTMPALDATSSKPAFLKIKVQPERTIDKPGDNKPIQGHASKKQALWSPSNFRLNIDDSRLKQACEHVDKIDEMTIKQNVKSIWVGADRFPSVEPTGLEFPNLTFYLAAAYAQPFFDWHKEMVVDGKTNAQSGVSGSIEYLDHAQKRILLELDLYDMGITACTLDKVEANSESIQKVKVELFCHSMALKYGDGLG